MRGKALGYLLVGDVLFLRFFEFFLGLYLLVDIFDTDYNVLFVARPYL